MKTRIIFSTLLYMLICALVFGAAAEGGFLLPTSIPLQKEGSGVALPTPIAEQRVILPLPNPAKELLVNEVRQMGDIEMNGVEYSMLEYMSRKNLSGWLDRCTAAGYVWSFTNTALKGYEAYSVSGGGHTAYLVDDYGGHRLLLLPEGMKMESGIKEDEEYSLNTIRMTMNGNVYYGVFDTVFSSIDFSTNLRFDFRDYDDISKVLFSLPLVESGKQYFASQDSNQDNIEFDLQNKSGTAMDFLQTAQSNWANSGFQNPSLLNGNSTYSKQEKNRFHDKNDYYQIRIIYKNGKEIRFQFDASFDAGQTVINGTGWMKLESKGGGVIWP